jgi:hypothetical protein
MTWSVHHNVILKLGSVATLWVHAPDNWHRYCEQAWPSMADREELRMQLFCSRGNALGTLSHDVSGD